MKEPQNPHENSALLTRWIWRGYLRHYWPMLLVAFLLMTIEGGMLGLMSYMIEPMFDRIFLAGERSSIPLVAGGIFLIFTARALSGFCQRVLMSRVGQKVSAHIQRDLVAHMLTLDNRWFQQNPPGVLIERVRGDTNAASNIWSTVLAAAGRDVIAMVSLFAVALSIDWLWTLIAVAGVPLLVLPIILLQRFVRRTARRVRDIAAELATRLDEIFHGVPTIKLNRMEDRESGRFANASHALVRARTFSVAGQAGIPAMMDIMAGVGFLGVLSYGGLQIIDGQKTVGEFMSFFTAMALVFEPLRRLGNVTGAWQVALASLERVYGVFLEQPTILSPAQPAKLSVPAAQADIVLDDVRMAYDETPVLNGVSFTAKAGKVTALVGASGAGKSTVFNLLTRLVDPQSGQISIGGTPIDTLALTDLRDQFSVVTQDAQLFDETLRDNILLGREDIAEDRLATVLDAAHVADFLPRLADGLNSPAGPRGSNLSGGQRQRVAIARALLRNAPILLLDEATSALDTKSERIVQEALDQLSRNRTTLVIAHRLATVRDADKIVVMDKGRVVEEGTHDSLLARDGVYSGLYKLQFSTQN
ncbi:ABC transporter ATP-binding protein [Actibacterium ureilyticum]|uniref:ABC transporter ATP-binding protein n=1 Tax=Actibacterium ureilyticum TaxID=1590614 RepID=UPI000BAB089B|nr:ABC transporter ATP-binding protein [Actibacterium ureilyticum]